LDYQSINQSIHQSINLCFAGYVVTEAITVSETINSSCFFFKSQIVFSSLNLERKSPPPPPQKQQQQQQMFFHLQPTSKERN
jgi:hypothetical protein